MAPTSPLALARLLAVGVLSAAIACSSSSEVSDDSVDPSTAEPTAEPFTLEPRPSPSYAQSFSEPLVQNTYKIAVQICYYDPPGKLARELGTSLNPEAIARAYSLTSTYGAHQDAAYVGCLEGLSAPGSGQRQEFGR